MIFLNSCAVFLVFIPLTLVAYCEARRFGERDIEKKNVEERSAEERDLEERAFVTNENRNFPYYVGNGPRYGQTVNIKEEKRWYGNYGSNRYSSYSEEPQRNQVNGLTQDQINTIVNLHNKLRLSEQASNMEKLRYNQGLARLAQAWSQRCVFEHDDGVASEAETGFSKMGQNIYVHSDPRFKVEDAVQGWYDEKYDYDYNSLTCRPGKACGHYTAVTWAQSTDIGCGLTLCPHISGYTNAHFIVCNYGPEGNFWGVKPFLKGPPCTQCDSGTYFCNDGLCDSSCKTQGPNCNCKAQCKNCGTKTRDCRCNCPQGIMGKDCSEFCGDKDEKCGQNPGYPDVFCNWPDPKWAFIKDVCPKMCGVCTPRTSPPTCRKRKRYSHIPGDLYDNYDY